MTTGAVQIRRKLRVCVLTNMVVPHFLPLFRDLRDSVGDLMILVSTPMESNRDWDAEWGDLSLRVQKSWTYLISRRHDSGFKVETWRHIPYDTLPLLVRYRPQVIVSTELGFRTMQAAVYRRLFPKSRLIVWNGFSEHTEKGLPAWRTFQRRLFYRAADAASANGESAIGYLLRLGVARQKIFRLPYCPDIAPLLKLPLVRDGDAATRLLYVGQLIERKGLAPFLKVLSNWLLQHPEEKRELWIAGEGPLRSDLGQLPVPSQLRLTFLGSVAHDKLPELYAQAGLFVFPTLSDEWGMVVNEALAAGLPVLGSVYSQAVEELVREGITGWTFRPDRPNEVRQALDRALLTPTSALTKLREICRQAVGHLRPSDGAERLLRAIDFVVCGTSRG